MSDPMLGEIRMFAGPYEPMGWAICDGRILQISEYSNLYSLIGNAFGGDGINTFALPDFRGRIPLHRDSTHTVGTMGGAETVTLNLDQMGTHDHSLSANSDGAASATPSGVFGTPTNTVYGTPDQKNAVMNPLCISANGGGQPHDNMVPFLAVNFIISLGGFYPSRS